MSEPALAINGTAQRPGGSQENGLAELEQLLGFHISLANTTIKAHFQGQSAALGLTHKQIAILWLIDAQDGTIQSELARALRVKRATMWGMVGRLCARGLLERPGTDETDARHVALKLTEAGRDLLARAKQAIFRHEEWLKRHFDAHERRAITNLMARIYRDRSVEAV